MAADHLAALADRRARVEDGLRSWLRRATAEAPPALAEAMGYSLLAPGKRLRPLLVMLTCEAVGGPAEVASTPAQAGQRSRMVCTGPLRRPWASVRLGNLVAY